MVQLSLFDGQTKKEMGQAQVLRNTNEEWKEMALHLIRSLTQDGREITSDDIRMLIINPDNPNSWGAIFSCASKQKIIRKTGRYIQSKIPSCQGRMIAVWCKY